MVKTAWPADKVERRKVSELVPYARNARTHSDAQVRQIAASIEEWGWTNPILVDESGGLIAGHGRLMAADKLGLKDVPVMVATGWTEAQKKAYILADNQLALNAGWDTEMLSVELKDLEGEFDLDLIGFNSDFLADMLIDGTEGLTDPDEIPDVPDEPQAKLGDVYKLGKHRLVCGDSTDADVVAKCLNGVEPHLMVTDPPYGVEYDPTARRSVQSKDSKPATGVVANDDRADWTEAWALFPGEVAYVWHAGNKAHIVAESLQMCDFNIRAQIIWAKSKFVIGRADYHPHHEPCWYAVRKNGKGHWNSDRKQSTLWQIDHRKSETGHSTQKPVECMRKPIMNNSSPGQAIYEPFCGSGTTLIACEMEGRACHAIELSPAYIDVIIKRWEDFTGEKAELERELEDAC
mgnify:CR=1 FL=1